MESRTPLATRTEKATTERSSVGPVPLLSGMAGSWPEARSLPERSDACSTGHFVFGALGAQVSTPRVPAPPAGYTWNVVSKRGRGAVRPNRHRSTSPTSGSLHRRRGKGDATWCPSHPGSLSRFAAGSRRPSSPRTGAGLRPVRLHGRRHTFATPALQARVHPKVVSEILGHANISITLDVYSHAIPSMQEEAAERVAALLFTPPATVGLEECSKLGGSRLERSGCPCALRVP